MIDFINAANKIQGEILLLIFSLVYYSNITKLTSLLVEIMGPITLFDKSFLQSLTLDESVWFDHFFLTNVAPVFYVETLADLNKTVRRGRTPEQEVRIIAEKFPDMNGNPCSHHTDLCINSLLGHSVPMTGQIPMSQGRLVKNAGKSGAVFQQSPESEAFSRWQHSEFQEIERRFARSWRNALTIIELPEIASYFQSSDIEYHSCKNLNQASDVAKAIVNNQDLRSGIIQLVIRYFNVPRYLHHDIRTRWRKAGYPSLADFAPYAAFVLTVELFFFISLASSLISKERVSNRIDIAYLFYLPFCMMFVSNDRLHRSCVPLFLREDQEFVWGQDLKTSLSKINEYYALLPESEKEKGIITFDSDLPPIDDHFIEDLWNRLLPNYGDKKHRDVSDDSATSSPTIEEIKGMENLPTVSPEEIDFDSVNVDQVLIKRKVRRTRGSWIQVPKKLTSHRFIDKKGPPNITPEH